MIEDNYKSITNSQYAVLGYMSIKTLFIIWHKPHRDCLFNLMPLIIILISTKATSSETSAYITDTGIQGTYLRPPKISSPYFVDQFVAYRRQFLIRFSFLGEGFL